MHRVSVRWTMAIACSALCGSHCLAQAPRALSDEERAVAERAIQDMTTTLDQESARRPHETSDIAIFLKGVEWALHYGREFNSSDRELLEKATRRGRERLAGWMKDDHSRATQRGKIALGYRSIIDGSVQPYGLIVPQGYDHTKPIRLDVVLHGSTRAEAMTELRFINKFDEGDGENSSPPEQSFIELHPLGRVENCYRWSGEVDVFEAIEDVCRRYNIDRDRIVLRGMSMGASGTWHLGLKHPDRFVALGPYCGYVDTHHFSMTPIPHFVQVGPLPTYQELGLHMLDSLDYAANAGVVPVIACMGEKDIFFQAHVMMSQAMQREGLTLINLISPGTGHVLDPVTHAAQMRLIAERVIAGRKSPSDLRFVTWTLKYSRCHWLEILGLKQHYARAELSAQLRNDELIIAEPRNVTQFAITTSQFSTRPKSVQIGSIKLAIPSGKTQADERILVSRWSGDWQVDNSGLVSGPQSRKRPGLQGPIDDAFTSPFLCVRGTGEPWNVAANDYANASLRRFSDEWHHYFRGTLPIKNDVDVTDTDLRTRHLILFGDPGSNRWIAKVLPQLPLSWTKQSLRFAGHDLSSAEHVPALIAPNPLPGADEHYVVLNSGHTFRESELSKVNYLLFPRWGDWAILKIDSAGSNVASVAETVLSAGFFDEEWQIQDAKQD